MRTATMVRSSDETGKADDPTRPRRAASDDVTETAQAPEQASGPERKVGQGPAAISCKAVSFAYKKDKPVLTDVSFEVQTGEIFGLLGPNGAGKSSLVKIMLGLNNADSGSILWFGEPLTRETRRRVGYVPQDLALLYDLSAVDNVRYFGRLYGLSGRTLDAQVEQTLNFVGLWEERKKLPGQYSGGMKRRLNIACGIVHAPDVVIMDEPTVGVDPQSRNHILESIGKLADRGTTIVYISHYMEEVERLCSRIGVIDSGTYLCGGTLGELLEQYASDAILTMHLAPNATVRDADLVGLNVLQQTPETVSIALVEGDMSELGTITGRFDGLAQRFTYLPPNLEQVFFRLTRKALRD